MTSKANFIEQTLAIDFGNSRVKILYNNIFKSFRYTEKLSHDFQNFFKTKVKTPLRVLYSSVNPEQSTAIINFLNTLPNVYVYNTFDLIQRQKKINLFNYYWVGSDRILGLLGGLEEFAPPLITIDIGTAVTVNCLDSERNFIGGVIFPGPDTQVKALQENTSLLKSIKLSKQDFGDIVEISTEGAITSGIINSIWGGLVFILDEIRRVKFNEVVVPVVFTGGGFVHFKSRYQHWEYEKKFYRKNLVLSGIISLARSERQYLIDFSQ
ncbi:MAG: type III pantothenate kinase [Candidatus Kapaibacteriota bacterium]|jgi:type III pantothenate kinase